MAASKVSVKLLVDTKGRRVLFAEAGKDFVDFVIYLLSLPLGTVAKLLSEKSMVGSFSNLYGSIGNLNETYFQQNLSKESVLNHLSLSNNVSGIPPLLLLSDDEKTARKLYTCVNHRYGTDVENMTCPGCKSKMTSAWSYVSPTTAVSTGGTVAEGGGGGFVKGVVTYMIMDNLEVMPMSTISSITLLNKFNVKDVSGLEEKIVDVGVDEGLKLLKASMECKTVFTSVFLET